mmetsp:Transcript_49242/g.110868  ORF Transcript_49242/g.110868 Transcript_49242/m.110868 type:complete len:227 (-) Transcript_49242:929-1609(-)
MAGLATSRMLAASRGTCYAAYRAISASGFPRSELCIGAHEGNLARARTVQLGLASRNNSKQWREGEACHGVNEGSDEKGVAVAVRVGKKATHKGTATPGHAGEALDGVPTPALRGGGEVHENGAIDGVGTVSEAATHEVDHQQQGQVLDLGEEDEAQDVGAEEEQRGLRTAQRFGQLLRELHEKGNHERVGCLEAANRNRAEVLLLDEEQVEELHGHACTDGCDQV